MQLYLLQMFKEIILSQYNSLDCLVLFILDYRFGVLKPQFRAFKRSAKAKSTSINNSNKCLLYGFANGDTGLPINPKTVS